MYEINNLINKPVYGKLQVQKLANTNAFETLSISPEKGVSFPEHISPANAQLVMLAGDLVFFIEGKSFQLKEHQYLGFPKETKHWVKAIENSKFLIIR